MINQKGCFAFVKAKDFFGKYNGNIENALHDQKLYCAYCAMKSLMTKSADLKEVVSKYNQYNDFKDKKERNDKKLPYCVICLYYAENQSEVDKGTLCQSGHWYHCDCAKEWKKKNGKCPICKGDWLDVDGLEEIEKYFDKKDEEKSEEYTDRFIPHYTDGTPAKEFNLSDAFIYEKGCDECSRRKEYEKKYYHLNDEEEEDSDN